MMKLNKVLLSIAAQNNLVAKTEKHTHNVAEKRLVCHANCNSNMWN